MMQTGVDGSVRPQLEVAYVMSPKPTTRDVTLLGYGATEPLAFTVAQTIDGPYVQIPGLNLPGAQAHDTASFSLMPSAPLADGWYTFRFVAHSGVVPGYTPPVLDDGVYESYFRVGSAPIVIAATACTQYAETDVTLTFSEPIVVPNQAAAFPVSVGGKPLTCRMSAQDSTAGSSCDKVAIVADANGGAPDITVSVPGNVVTSLSSGLPARNANGETSFTFQIPSKPDDDGCRRWQETRVPK